MVLVGAAGLAAARLPDAMAGAGARRRRRRRTVCGLFQHCCIHESGDFRLLQYIDAQVRSNSSTRRHRRAAAAGDFRCAASGRLHGGLLFAIFFFGADIMRLLYRDEVYAGNSNVLGLLALAALATTVGIPASLALAATGRARAVAAVMLLSAVVNTALVSLLLARWGLLGAAYAVLIGETLGAIGRWTAFWLIVPLADSSGSSAKPSNAWPLQV